MTTKTTIDVIDNSEPESLASSHYEEGKGFRCIQ